MYWVNKSKFEVSGLGTIKVQEDGSMLVTQAILLKQQNTHTHTEITAEAVCKAMFDMAKEDGELRWWWHSHVQMGVFWSGTDMDTIKELGKQGWIAATVFNQKNELRSAVYAHDALVLPWVEKPKYVFYDECETSVKVIDDARTVEWEKEYEDKVTNATSFTHSRSREWPGRGAAWCTATQNWIPGSGTRDTTDEDSTATNAKRGHLFIYEKHTPEQLKQAFRAKIAKDRPTGMTKKDWWSLSHMVPASQDALLTKSELYWDKTYEDAVQGKLDAAVKSDPFGLTTSDWEILTTDGFTKEDVDFFVNDADFSPAELLALCEEHVGPEEIRYMLAHGYTQAGIVALAAQNRA